MPAWLTYLSWASLALGLVCALVTLADIAAGHRQKMWVMDAVWPITALYAGPLALCAYYSVGRLSTRQVAHQAQEEGKAPPGKQKPFWQMAGVAATHCGAGCTLGDVCAEWLLFAVPLTLLGSRVFATWVAAYLFAYAFGIAFQYFTIAPMRHLSVGEGLWAALKADTLSLTAWQVGMYGWMAVAIFAIFRRELEPTDPVMWFMMQLAMIAGFLTSYPVNWWLLRAGVKEKM